MMSTLILLLFAFVANGYMFPKWKVTYQMNRSTIVMPCNSSGYMNDDAVKEIARYGVVDFDWSNAKQLWANTSPMDCQQRLLSQAQSIKAANPNTKVFVYRNLAKALPWFSDVREKLMDPAYNNWWFLKFKPQGPYHVNPCTNTSISKCSMFYHDQGQTPEHPSGDGSCKNECDCGGGANNKDGLPCGEYLWDHRNASLRQWLTDVHIMGPANGTGLNNAAIDGFYIDDGWSDKQDEVQSWMPKNGYCDTYNKFGGITEEDYLCAQDMGMTASNVEDQYQGWLKSMQSAQQAIVAGNGFNWQLFHGAGSPNKANCASWLRGSGKNYIDSPLMYTYTTFPDSSQQQLNVDLAIFLLIRGDYAWLGYGWNGCYSTWKYQWNDMLDKDYGVPVNNYTEVNSGVFQRKYSKSVVEINCNTYQPSFNFS